MSLLFRHKPERLGSDKSLPSDYDILAPHLFAALPYSPLASPNSLHMYFSNPPALLHKRQQSTESHYEGMDEFTGGDEATDAGKFVIVVKDGQPTVEWPWNAKDFNGHPYPGFDADLQVRLQRWLSRPEWQGAMYVILPRRRSSASPS